MLPISCFFDVEFEHFWIFLVPVQHFSPLKKGYITHLLLLKVPVHRLSKVADLHHTVPWP